MPDPTFGDAIDDAKRWPDEIRLTDLHTYMLDNDLTKESRDVRLTFTMAHGESEVEPVTLGDVRRNFDGRYGFKAPNGAHGRMQIVATFVAPKQGEAHPGHVPTTFIFVRR